MNEKEHYSLERRKTHRFNARYFACISFGEEKSYASVTNISEDGIGIVLTTMLPVGDIVELKISSKVGNMQKMEIHLKSRVSWINSSAREKVFQAGLKIIEIEREDVERFNKAVESLKDKSEKNE